MPSFLYLPYFYRYLGVTKAVVNWFFIPVYDSSLFLLLLTFCFLDSSELGLGTLILIGLSKAESLDILEDTIWRLGKGLVLLIGGLGGLYIRKY